MINKGSNRYKTSDRVVLGEPCMPVKDTDPAAPLCRISREEF